MSTLKPVHKVEDQLCQIDRARAVLTEVEHYFESKNEAEWLPYYAEHILLLLHVAGGLLHDVTPELSTVVNELTAQCRAEKEDKST